MAQYSGLVLTNAGIALLNKVLVGANLQFTRCAVGDGELGDTEELKDLTALISLKGYVDINRLEVKGGNATLRIGVTNAGLMEGYYLREIGIYAEDPDEGEILYAVTNAEETADFMPAYEGGSVVEWIIDLVCIVDSAASVSAVIDESLVYASRAELLEHTEREDNPHNVTAEQAGAVRMATGQYTGDDAVTRLIEVGFAPKYVKIVAATISEGVCFETYGEMFQNGIKYFSYKKYEEANVTVLNVGVYPSGSYLSSDGFYADRNRHPVTPSVLNKDGKQYSWVAFG